MIKRIKLKPKTPFSSVFSSDQIWGQFIWAISDLYGEDKVTEIIKLYTTNKPPILFSAAMIDGYLPKPLFVNAFADFANEIEKSNKKCKWLTYEDFSCLQNDSNYLKGKKLEQDSNDAISDELEIHVSISGDTLYNVIYKKTKIPIIVYVDIQSEEWNEVLQNIIKNHWSIMGLGGDKNVGRGQFDISMGDLSSEEKKIFNFRSDSGFISLSQSFGQDLEPVFYNVEVYSGFVGRKNDIDGIYRKKPIIRYLPGSFFKKGKGCVVQAVDNRNIFSYGLSFPVYMKLENSNDQEL